MFAELLTVERNELMRDLFETYPYKPYLWVLGKERENVVDKYIFSQINEVVKSGGIARAYCFDGKVQGLCVIRPDNLAMCELHRRAYRITHLLAIGKPDVQFLIKSLLVRETLRGLPKDVCIVARCPYSDLTSINALERYGFFTTHTALILAKDLSNTDWLTTPAEDYEVTPLTLENFDGLDEETLDIPEGVLGWDVNLPKRTLSQIHRDWLRTYAFTARNKTTRSSKVEIEYSPSSHLQTLLAAYDQGRVVGIVADRTKLTTRNSLGFNVGTIDILTTAPEYRGNGVSTKLIKESLNQFAQNRVRVAELVLHSNDNILSQYYQEMGFFTVNTTLTLVYYGEMPRKTKGGT
ncbi:MAG: GNAT family N-acetyltransferase [bacterium]